MTSNRIIYLILCAFIAGNLLVIFMQYNSSKNIQLLITGNKRLLNEMRSGNQLREIEQDLLSSEVRIGRAVATNDSTPLKQSEMLLEEALVSSPEEHLHASNASILCRVPHGSTGGGWATTGQGAGEHSIWLAATEHAYICMRVHCSAACPPAPSFPSCRPCAARCAT